MEAVSNKAAEEETVEKSPSRVRAVVACAAVTLLCGVGVWLTDRHYRLSNQFDHTGTAVEMNAETQCAAKSSITLYTNSADKSGTDSGLYFCNGRDLGYQAPELQCIWLDNPAIDDLEEGQITTFTDIDTVKGSSEWFCLCGTRDRWQGKINEMNFCGQSLTVEPKTLDLSAYIYDTTAYECSKYQVSEAGVITDVQNARFGDCDMRMVKLTLRTDETSSEDYPEGALTLKYAGMHYRGPIDRVSVNDFKRGHSAIFTVPMDAGFRSSFDICTNSDKVYAGELLRISSRYQATDWLYVPKETPVVFTIKRTHGLYHCAKFRVRFGDVHTFEFVEYVTQNY